MHDVTSPYPRPQTRLRSATSTGTALLAALAMWGCGGDSGTASGSTGGASAGGAAGRAGGAGGVPSGGAGGVPSGGAGGVPSGGAGGVPSGGAGGVPSGGAGGVPSGGTGGSSACGSLVCEQGQCVDGLSGPSCLCDPHYSGTTCGDCARGYAGTTCNDCADGFVLDATGACLLDPCASEDCSAHGTCSVGAAGPVCECETGFAGANCSQCATGYTGAACDICDSGFTLSAGECVLVECVTIECTIHGTCQDIDSDGTGECVCERGYTGRDCGTCAQGFIEQNGVCVYDTCAGVDCGHGSCTDAGSGAVCECDSSYTGTSCDACAEGYSLVGGSCENVLPVTTSVWSWFDAADLPTITATPEGKVESWASKVDDNTWLHDDGYNNVSSQPTFTLLPPGVHFYGEQYLASYGKTVPQGAHYTMFFVVEWSPSEGEQVLFAGLDPDTGKPALELRALDASTVRFSHRVPSADSGGDQTTGTFFDATSGRQLVVARRAPLGNGTVQALSNGTDVTTNAAGNTALDATIALAGTTKSGQYDQALHGAFYEIVTYEGTLSGEQVDSVEAYLRVKWGL